MNILLMDDEDQVRKVTARMLEFLGHTVTDVADGHDVLEVYRNNTDDCGGFDFVILDIMVDCGLGGKETLKELLAIDPSVRAVAMSGFVEGIDAKEFQRHGFRWILPKPLSLEELQAVLLEIHREVRQEV